jgi:HEAT repeat protein
MGIDALLAQLRLDAAKPAGDRTRYGAAWELQDDPASVASFLPLLDDADAGVRELAVWLVASFAQAYGDDDERAELVEPALPRVRELAAADPVEAVRENAVRALQFFAIVPRLRDEVLAALERALRDPDPDVRVTAAFGLERTGTALPAVAAELGAALQRPEPPRSNLHQEACMMLTAMGRAAAPGVPGLLALLMEAPDPDLTESIIEALGAAATPEALAQLRDMDDPDSHIGRVAGRALLAARGA